MRIRAVIIGIICGFLSQPNAFTRAGDTTPGPYRWQNAQIVGGGFVSGIITNPNQKGLIYCRTDIGGAYRLDPKTHEWVSVSHWIGQEDWNYTGTESLAIDPSDANRVYIAAGSYTNSWAGNGAILRSSDQGRSWQVTPLPFKNGGNEDGRNNGERLMVDPNDGAILLFGSRRNGMWRSSDHGEHWQPMSSFPQISGTNGMGINFVMFDASSGPRGKPTPVIFAGVSTHGPSLYRSDDAGATWKAVQGQPLGMLPHRSAWGADHLLYITYGNKPGPNGVTNGDVYKVDTKSNQWTTITPLRPNGRDDVFGYAGVAVDHQHRHTLIVSTLDRWTHGDELFRSRDDGKTWVAIGPRSDRDFSAAPWLTFGQDPAPNGPLGHWIASVEIDPYDSDHVLYTTGWGMWGTDDMTSIDRGGRVHWTVAAKGIEECVVNNVISPPDGAHVLDVVWDINGFRHTNLDRPPRLFFEPDEGSNFGLDFAESRPQVMARVYGKATGGAWSSDDGMTWTPFRSHPEQAFSGSVAMSSDGAVIAWSPDSQPQIYSRDHGNTWTRCAGLPEKAAVVSCRAEPNVFFAFDPRGGEVFKSSDAAAHFSEVARGLPRGDGNLKATPGIAGDLWLASAGGVYHSTDAGRNFRKVGDAAVAWKVGFGKAAPGQGYPAVFVNAKMDGEYGIFRSDDQGRHWLKISDNDHNFGELNALSGDPRVYGRVYLASTNFGVVYGDLR